MELIYDRFFEFSREGIQNFGPWYAMVNFLKIGSRKLRSVIHGISCIIKDNFWATQKKPARKRFLFTFPRETKEIGHIYAHAKKLSCVDTVFII